MKKLCYVLVLLLCYAFLAGCGREDRDRTEAEALQDGVTEYRDIRSDSKEVFNMDGVMGTMVGLQFYMGERVMIWATRNNGLADIYLYREDGSRETLLEGMPEDYYFANWFLDAEGEFYRWSSIDSLVKMDRDGKELYRIPLEDIGMTMIVDLCQLANGRVLITYSTGAGASSYTLSEVDPDTGKVSQVGTVRLDGFGRVAAGTEGLLYLDNNGVLEINLDNGSKERILSFVGTSYRLREDIQWNSIKNFRVLEDGSVEFLRYKRDQESWDKAYISEVLRAETETTQKTVLSMRCWKMTGSWGPKAWLKIQVERFNQQSDSYLVVLDECPEGTDREDFSRQTSIEMMVGKGPDLLYGDVLGDYAYGAIQKGVLADLAPYMEASGIKEEDYFPAAFGCWREGDGVYGVRLDVMVNGWRFRKGVLEGGGVPDGEALADALLAWPEDAVLSVLYDSGDALRYLLEGSGDFWGILDWEAGTCDFSGAFFAKILEAAKRYGNDGMMEKLELIEPRSDQIVEFDTTADQEAEGMEAAGVLFDDGFHPAVTNSYDGMMAVNANSAHAEGAWEFISFLLGDEAQLAFQSTTNSSGYGIPVHKGAFEECIKKQIAFYSQVHTKALPGYRIVWGSGQTIEKYPRSTENISDEKVAEYREFLEDARPLPIRTAPLLDIIVEEAEYYFEGTKNIEEVSAIIQNRVQLYMDENR